MKETAAEERARTGKAKKRAKKEKSQFDKDLKAFHKASPRHVLALEADLDKSEKTMIFDSANILRKAGNKVVAEMQRCYDQLVRTKAYRGYLKEYDAARDADDQDGMKAIGAKMKVMQEQYGVTWDHCRTFMADVCNDMGITQVFGLTRAEDIWSGVKKILYSNGKRLHFKKYGDLPPIQANQTNRGIPLHMKDEKLFFSYGGIDFTFKDRPDDKFLNDEVTAVMEYLRSPDICDAFAVEQYNNDETITDTYRPCYAALVCKTIRNKKRVYIHLTIEGKAMPKFRKITDAEGNISYVPRHKYGTGPVGVDIGTQTIGYTSNTEVGLINLAERGRSIEKNEAMERRLYRAMDRSRRAMDPQYYNEDGTIKKGKKHWVDSKRYQRMLKKHRELCRKNAESRRYANKEIVNHLRELGDVFITEPKNADKLKKKAKESKKTVTEDGKVKFSRRKRYGHSVQDRCPGGFQAQVEQVYEITGGEYHEVSKNFRASQYDHTSQEYVKKKLSQRMYDLSDGTNVQRDMYSSFLLYCSDDTYETIDQKKCEDTFDKFLEMERKTIDDIAHSGHKVMNSGIKLIAASR